MTAAFTGVKVLDLSRLLPGPFCSMMLADFGADVIKVEGPDSPDPGRGLSEAYFQSYNRNKRGIIIDLKHPDGVETILRLVERADVFAQNMRQGVMEKLGLGYEVMKGRNPGIIFASASGAPMISTRQQRVARRRAHSSGGVSSRWYVKFLSGKDKVRDYVSLAGAHHGNDLACLFPTDGGKELCPSYTTDSQSVLGKLNGVGDAVPDETPFGVEEGGGVSWNALWSNTDIVIQPNQSECLDQATKKADAAINFAAGDRVYWDDTNNQATSTATGNTFLGWSTIVAGNTAATVDVLMPYRLYGAPAASANQAAVTPTQDTITDNSTGAASTTIAAFTNLDTLTDSTGGTADNTVADVSTVVTGVDGAGSNAASKADVDTRLTAINNNFKELVDQIISQKAGNTVLVNAVASIAAQLAKIKTDIAANKTLANEIRTLLIALGLWKGAA